MTYLSLIHTRHPYNDPHSAHHRDQRKPKENPIPLDALPHIVVITDKHGDILDINQNGAKFLGYGKTELVGMKLLQNLTPPPPSDEKQAPESERTFSKQVEHMQATHKIAKFVRKDGSVFPANVSMTKYTTPNGAEQFLTTIIDCTEHQRKLLGAKNYASNLLHDARGAIGVVQHGLGLARTCDLTPEMSGYINVIGIGTADLEVLVNDTLDLEKALDEEKPKLSDCYLKKFLLDTLEPSIALAKAHNKELNIKLDTISAQTFCSLPYLALGAVLRNLLSNAIKFTPVGSKTPICCEISLPSSANAEGMTLLSFKVTNGGAGFTPEQKARIFTPFQQASDEISKQFGGSGIGLPKTKKVIEKAGGTLDAESIPMAQLSSEDSEKNQSTPAVPSKLTTFFGTLPISIIQVPILTIEPPQLKTPKTPSEPRRVLFVDDEAVPRRWGCRTLEKRGGHTVVTAGTVEEAVTKAREAEFEFDVVVTDLDLKTAQNGIDLIEKLRKSPRQSKHPLKTIVLTGNPLPRKTALEAGIDQCIPKGSNTQVLLDAIDDCFKPPE